VKTNAGATKQGKSRQQKVVVDVVAQVERAAELPLGSQANYHKTVARNKTNRQISQRFEQPKRRNQADLLDTRAEADCWTVLLTYDDGDGDGDASAKPTKPIRDCAQPREMCCVVCRSSSVRSSSACRDAEKTKDNSGVQCSGFNS